MIPASLYHPIYLLLVLLLTANILPKYTTATMNVTTRRMVASRNVAFYLCIFLILFIGLRPIDGIYFVDMISYAESYELIQGGGWLPLDNYNYIYDSLFVGMALAGIPVTFFFVLIAVIYFIGIYFACKKIFPNDILVVFVAYLGAFSTFSFGTNGIKAGAAASLFLLAIAYRDKKLIAALFLFLSLGFHHAMAAPIAAYMIAFFVKKGTWFLYFWFFSLVLAALHITSFMDWFANQTDEHGAGYLNSNAEDAVRMVSGFRPDFILYSAVPIFLGNYLINKYRFQSDYYNFIWSVYTLTNSVFLLCTYGIFINRIAYLSWLLYPIVLLYPFLNIKWSRMQYRHFKTVVWGHLGFTLFMYVIYALR